MKRNLVKWIVLIFLIGLGFALAAWIYYNISTWLGILIAAIVVVTSVDRILKT
jgi:uncharacterized membrane protein